MNIEGYWKVHRFMRCLPADPQPQLLGNFLRGSLTAPADWSLAVLGVAAVRMDPMEPLEVQEAVAAFLLS